MTRHSNHEDFFRSEDGAPGSERAFGLVMAVAFALLAILNFWHQKHEWPWLSAIALCFAGSGVLAPYLLKPFNRVWYRFAMLLHAVVNPIVMGILFFGAIWPTGLIFRLHHKNLLRLGWELESESYWIVRQPPGPAPQTMKDQF